MEFTICITKGVDDHIKVKDLSTIEELVTDNSYIRYIDFKSELTGKIEVWNVEGDGGQTGDIISIFANNIRKVVFNRLGHALLKYAK